jgi:hypothetical protein
MNWCLTATASLLIKDGCVSDGSLLVALDEYLFVLLFD